MEKVKISYLLKCQQMIFVRTRQHFCENKTALLSGDNVFIKNLKTNNIVNGKQDF